MADRVTPLGAGERLWLDRLIAPLPRGGTILVLHGGGGEPIARYLIDHGFHVFGVDPSATLTNLARTRFPRERWQVSDMRHVEIDEAFEGILAWDCLSRLSRGDQGAMAARAAAWMKPGARLLFNAETADKVAAEGYRPGSRYSEDLSATDYSGALARAGLVEMAHVAHDPGCGGAGVWLARKPDPLRSARQAG